MVPAANSRPIEVGFQIAIHALQQHLESGAVFVRTKVLQARHRACDGVQILFGGGEGAGHEHVVPLGVSSMPCGMQSDAAGASRTVPKWEASARSPESQFIEGLLPLELPRVSVQAQKRSRLQAPQSRAFAIPKWEWPARIPVRKMALSARVQTGSLEPSN